MNDVYLHYLGKHKGSLVGVPARDLSYKEARDAGGAEFLIGTGLYEYVIEKDISSFIENRLTQKRKKHSKKESEE